jgi:hypothetical protein
MSNNTAQLSTEQIRIIDLYISLFSNIDLSILTQNSPEYTLLNNIKLEFSKYIAYDSNAQKYNYISTVDNVNIIKNSLTTFFNFINNYPDTAVQIPLIARIYQSLNIIQIAPQSSQIPSQSSQIALQSSQIAEQPLTQAQINELASTAIAKPPSISPETPTEILKAIIPPASVSTPASVSRPAPASVSTPTTVSTPASASTPATSSNKTYIIIIIIILLLILSGGAYYFLVYKKK